MASENDAEQWNRVKAIFAAALEESNLARRASYLKNACRDDDALLAKVQALLDAHDSSDGSGGTGALLPPQDNDFTLSIPLQTLQPQEIVAKRFRVLRFLGRGGMGEVYEAEDTELGGHVAIKTIRTELLENPTFLGRFRREVSLARQVTHPNICRVFDVGSDVKDGVPRAFFTMELLEGESLAQVLKRSGKLSTEAALPVVAQMAAGLDALHQQGVIHRDFKPGNVILVQQSTGKTRAVIGDFGLARALETGDETPLSRSGQVFGTPDYMAPEQLLGKPVSAATDIYAFGLVLYELVTGVRAFGGGRALENAVQRVTEQPTPPREKCPGLPARWQEAILRCLANDPNARFASAGEAVRYITGETDAPTLRFKPERSRISRIAMIGGFAAILLALSWFALRYARWGQGNAAETIINIAMLPLQVLTDEPDLRVFALGLVETMTGRISQFETAENSTPLLVVPASEVRTQEAKSAGDARRKFSVDTAIEGSLQRQGDRLRLILTVIDTTRMRQRETIVLEEERSNPVRLQDEAMARLANALHATLQSRYAQEALQHKQVTPGAYDYYLQARGYLQRSDQRSSVESSIQLLKRALNEDANYALAHSGLGEAYLAQFELTREPATMELALQSGRRGVDLNPALVETNVALGKIYLGVGRYEDGVRVFQKAIEIDNRRSEAYQGLANAYAKLNDFPKAEATFFKAIALRPGDWTAYKALGVYYISRREYQKAAEQFRKVVDLSPDNAQGYVNLGAAYSLGNQKSEAEQAWLTAQRLDPKRVSTLNNLGRLYFDRKEYQKAISIYEQVTQISTRSYRTWGQMGRAYGELGQLEKAKEMYRKAVAVLESEILVNPNNASMQGMLGFYRALTGQGSYAQSLRRSLELSPDSLEIQALAAETYAAAGERVQSIQLLRDVLRKGYPEETARSSHYLAPLIPLARQQAKQ
jgi:tetratricopeptide (TPR) repeat protein